VGIRTGFKTWARRRRAWRLLYGLPPEAPVARPPPAAAGSGPARAAGSGDDDDDAGAGAGAAAGAAAPVTRRQIMLDARRSMHFDVCRRWDAATRAARVAALRRVLAASFASVGDDSFPFYVQGAHDVASVILLALDGDEAAAGRLLTVLTHAPLRGFVQRDMDVATALLRVLSAVVAAADPPLAAHVEQACGGAPPVFALPWLLTWFSHSVDGLSAVGRLFDAFLAGHPLLPVYAAAALMVARRGDLLAADGHGEVYAAGSRLAAGIPALVTPHDLLAAAGALYRSMPPVRALAAAPAADAAVLRARWPELWHWAWEAPDPLLDGRPASAVAGDVVLLLAAGARLGPPAAELAAFGPTGGGGRKRRARLRLHDAARAVVAAVVAIVAVAAGAWLRGGAGPRG
jgi:hypothetical protein